jgi:hypothetical protein
MLDIDNKMKPIRYEILLMFERKYEPKDIIEFGYPKQTVYRYKKKWEKACQMIKTMKR